MFLHVLADDEETFFSFMAIMCWNARTCSLSISSWTYLSLTSSPLPQGWKRSLIITSTKFLYTCDGWQDFFLLYDLQAVFTRLLQILRNLNLEVYHSKRYSKFCSHHGNIGFNLKILAQCPQGLLRWNNAKCKQTHSQNPSVKAICWIGTLVSKLSLFTWHSHSSFIRSHSSFIFEPLDFLGFKFGKYLRKKLRFYNPETVHTTKMPEFILENFISREFSPPCGHDYNVLKSKKTFTSNFCLFDCLFSNICPNSTIGACIACG